MKILLSTLLLSSSLFAADWLMLQGSEAQNSSDTTPHLWGFVQVNYKADEGIENVNSNGIYTTSFARLAPNLQSQSGFNIGRMRIGVRGMVEKENKINYFILTAFENSGITNILNQGDRVGEHLVDASVTLKYIPYAKIRVGQFKTPSSEEALRATFASPYIEFTSFTFQQTLERQIDYSFNDSDALLGEVSASVNAYRDKGIQFFDTIKLYENWAFSYAYMYGAGSGIRSGSKDNQTTHYLYAALEDMYKAKGFYSESLKFYIWGQDGDRVVDVGVSGATKEKSYRRSRYGIGLTYYDNGLRITSELMGADGMIAMGAKDVNSDPQQEDFELAFVGGYDNVAYGGYLNAQYELYPKKFEIFSRYDRLDRLSNNQAKQVVFDTLTLGASYRFKGATRLDVNYAIRRATAPENSTVQKNLDRIGNRFMVQLTAVFK